MEVAPQILGSIAMRQNLHVSISIPVVKVRQLLYRNRLSRLLILKLRTHLLLLSLSKEQVFSVQITQVR